MCNLFCSYKELKSFERWQVNLSILTLLAASVIGFKQNQINQNLLDLNYEPSITIAYIAPNTNMTIPSPEFGRWRISNYGKENVSITNIILRDNNVPSIFRDNKTFFLNGQGKLVVPGNSVDFFTPATDEAIKTYKNTHDIV